MRPETESHYPCQYPLLLLLLLNNSLLHLFFLSSNSSPIFSVIGVSSAADLFSALLAGEISQLPIYPSTSLSG
ncbi:hypothetical protein CMV_007852 [Castanea mollissima]|uniref:Uncharacterized protein n=1 Tax=Castanea mollissima TaxID=60419 RepID=A0A8J4VSC3_9ROSI|nr:hypothetical protein CMV_007852 [Castanea mollissima]